MHRVLPFISLLLVLVAIALLWADGIAQPSIPRNFSYSADFSATNNLYDPGTRRYLGERYTAGSIYYRATAQTNKMAVVSGEIRYTDLSGKSLGKITREHTRHTPYVFAPRNLKEGQPFTYRHVVYDAPVQMRYEGSENIEGVQVYKYAAVYSNVRMESLAYEPTVRLWVEPVTGWLVRFEEAGIAYNYNQQTGALASPHHRYSIISTEENSKQQVAYARSLRYKQVFVRQVAPCVLLIVAFAAILAALARRYTHLALPLRLAAASIALSVVVSLAGWTFQLEALARLFVGSTAPGPVLSAFFLLAVFCIVCIRRHILHHVAVGVSVSLVVVALSLMVASIIALPSGFMHVYPYEAITALLLGIALMSALIHPHYSAKAMPVLMAGFVLVLGGLGVVVELLQLKKAFTLTFVYPTSLLASLLSVATGYTLLRVLQDEGGVRSNLRLVLRALVRPSIVAIPLLFIGIIAQIQHDSVRKARQTEFDRRVSTIQTSIVDKVESYKMILMGTEGLFAGSEAVETSEWQAYIHAITRVRSGYPGMQTMGFAQAVPAHNLDSYEREVAEEGATQYVVFPDSALPLRVPVRYLQPIHSENTALLGYDMFSDPTRSQAMTQARDTGEPNVSGVVDLTVQTADDRPGFLLFAPIYTNGASIDTEEQRRRALFGYTFATVDTEQMVQGVLGHQWDTVDVRIYDGQSTSGAVVYDRFGTLKNTASDQTGRLIYSETVYIAGRPWTFVFGAMPGFQIIDREDSLMAVILFGGGGMYAIFAIAFYILMVRRQRRGGSGGRP